MEKLRSFGLNSMKSGRGLLSIIEAEYVKSTSAGGSGLKTTLVKPNSKDIWFKP